MKVLIIGGVAGGASCTARLRRLDEHCEIIMFEKDEYISFANCGLPYYVGDVIEDREKLILQTPEAFSTQFKVDVRTLSKVIDIDPENKTVLVLDKLNNRKYIETYDKLVLAPGGKPSIPNIKGIKSDKIFTVRTIMDTDKIKRHITQTSANSAVVIGGGFTGVEMAENLKHLGLNVTLIEGSSQILAPLDFDMAYFAHEHMKSKGVNLLLNSVVNSFEDNDLGILIELENNETIQTDFVIFAAGSKPVTELAVKAKLTIGETGGILVDRNLKTSNESIYAVGDAIEVKDFVSGQKSIIQQAAPANKQGRIVADNLADINSKYTATLGTSIIKIFDLTIATTGNNEKQLIQSQIPFKKSHTQDLSHTAYYPGAEAMIIKLLFTQNGNILGAQIIGKNGVDKRIDILSTAIKHNLTVSDLAELPLAYAPPYGAAKDPINIAGMVAENILTEKVNVTYVENIQGTENIILIDVSTPQEYESGHLKGAFNIPLDELRNKISLFPKGKNIVVYCAKGLRAYLAYRILKQNGFENLMSLNGGYSFCKHFMETETGEQMRLNEQAKLSKQLIPIEPKTTAIKNIEVKCTSLTDDVHNIMKTTKTFKL